MSKKHRRDQNESRECVVLYVEDDDAAAYLFQHALQQAGTDVRLYRVSDGEKGMAFLLREKIYQDAPTPDLAVLDVNLPGISGLDVLARIWDSEVLKELPVVMFTSSSNPQDRNTALTLGSHEFFAKPSEWSDLLSTAKAICDLASKQSHTKHRAADQSASHIDYCLRTLGIRVWADSCQLIAKVEHWKPYRNRVVSPFICRTMQAVLYSRKTILCY